MAAEHCGHAMTPGPGREGPPASVAPDHEPAAASWLLEEVRRLEQAAADARPLPRLTRRRDGVSLAQAYSLQQHWADHRLRAGDTAVGYKVGLTSPAMQRQFGIDEPDSGILLASAQLPSDGFVPCAGLIAPRVEGEFAFRLGAGLTGVGIGENDVRAAIDGACLALEVIDSRYDLEGITLVDSVADNAACARFVLGEFAAVPDWDLRHEVLTVQAGGTDVAAGDGRQVLGDPIRSILWLVRSLAGRGTGLRAGDIVLTGAVHASLPLHPGLAVQASSPSLPPVRVQAV
ncbi:fumarylacetoacetate hydrolase family protein [Kitasatospora sp. NPDC097605]|uniref:2-keto-4-pentenoate hydratase n=1 Tax=Kitasatospora sp. NPDC097605 TaxID=3157226 RepID=UPI003330E9A6